MTQTEMVPIPYAHNRRRKLIANSIWNAMLLLVTLAVVAMAGAQAGDRLPRLLGSDILAIALPAIPLALLMASGELDLSLAAIMGLAAMVAAGSLQDGGSVLGAAAVGMGIGLFVGLVHAVLVGAARLNGALVTFVGAALLTGITMVLSGGKVIMARTEPAEVDLLNMLSWVILVLMLLIGVALIYFTPFGKRPGRDDPPEPLGKRMLFVGLPYVIGGMLAGLAGIVMLGRIQAATISIGATYQVRLMLIVLLGGTPLGRGVSNAFGAILAAVFTSALTVSLMTANIDVILQSMINGMLLAAVLLVVHAYHWLFGRFGSKPPAPQPEAPPAPPVEKSEAAPESKPEPAPEPPADKGDAPATLIHH